MCFGKLEEKVLCWEIEEQGNCWKEKRKKGSDLEVPPAKPEKRKN